MHLSVVEPCMRTASPSGYEMELALFELNMIGEGNTLKGIVPELNAW